MRNERKTWIIEHRNHDECRYGIDEHENDVNQMLRPSQSPDFNPAEHLYKILDQCQQSLGRMVSNPPEEFQRLEESVPRRFEAADVIIYTQ